ncbi:hypothetical protein J6I75_08645 [Pseudidiomarina sp. 1APP75-27a]|uniref:hypothetical protein n=1 Tax=Pseudidiomarina terrestris TaxID=2820060 RepID=UPI002B06183C|nr:hypothetical protein [Pseudidiomarina sp. 1APP75-27a]MEA3588419.1 hypothetical protein [Pseudidiomarina sp. 1APP75-27a]
MSHSNQSSQEQFDKALNNRLEDLRYNVELGIRYHMLRQSFFQSLHRWITALSLTFSTAAVAVLFDGSELGKWFAGLVAGLQALDLVVDTRSQVELHNDIRRDYLSINKFLSHSSKEYTHIDLDKASDDIKDNELKEPPVKRWLLEYVARDTDSFLGKDSTLKLNWGQVMFRHFW